MKVKPSYLDIIIIDDSDKQEIDWYENTQQRWVYGK